MEPREAYMKGVLRDPSTLHFTDIKFIYASQVTLCESARLRCLYNCPKAHQSVLSPPQCPTPEDMRRMLEEYRYGLMIRRETVPSETPDFSGVWRDFSTRMLEFEYECFIRGYTRIFAVAIGTCLHGHHDPSLRPCDFPGKSRPTFEALGIDPAATLQMINWDSFLIRDPDAPFNLFGLMMVE